MVVESKNLLPYSGSSKKCKNWQGANPPFLPK